MSLFKICWHKKYFSSHSDGGNSQNSGNGNNCYIIQVWLFALNVNKLTKINWGKHSF